MAARSRGCSVRPSPAGRSTQRGRGRPLPCPRGEHPRLPPGPARPPRRATRGCGGAAVPGVPGPLCARDRPGGSAVPRRGAAPRPRCLPPSPVRASPPAAGAPSGSGGPRAPVPPTVLLVQHHCPGRRGRPPPPPLRLLGALPLQPPLRAPGRARRRAGHRGAAEAGAAARPPRRCPGTRVWSGAAAGYGRAGRRRAGAGLLHQPPRPRPRRCSSSASLGIKEEGKRGGERKKLKLEC
nr:translation initiation factor IF-2 isoform X2 [Taeniopygia guttata]